MSDLRTQERKLERELARLTKQARAAFERMCRDKGTRIGEEMRDAIMEHMKRAKPAYWPVRE